MSTFLLAKGENVISPDAAAAARLNRPAPAFPATCRARRARLPTFAPSHACLTRRLAAKTAWAKELGVSSFDLLSDNYPYGEVARKYGVFREKDGISERAVFLIDKQGRIAWSKVYDIPQQPGNSELFEALDRLP